MKEGKKRSIKKVWCFECLDKSPPSIRKAEFLMPLRIRHYDLTSCGSSIDRRVIGICALCLKSKNEFQQSNAEPFNSNHPRLVYRNVQIK